MKFTRIPPLLSHIGEERQDPNQEGLTTVVGWGAVQTLRDWLVAVGLPKLINESKLFGPHVDLTDSEVEKLGIEPESFNDFRSRWKQERK